MRSMYESGEYLEKNAGWHAEDAPFKAALIANAIGRLRLPRAKICDIGCGSGEVIRELSLRLPDSRFVGYDISPHAHGIASKLEAPACLYRLGDGLDARDFDIAIAADVFEHVEDYYGFLRRMHSVSAVKIFHIPLDMSALAVGINNPMWTRREVGHLHYFSPETALATLRDCGYEIIDVRYNALQENMLRTLFRGGRTSRKLVKLTLLGLPRALLFRLSPRLCARLLGGVSLLVVAR